MKQAVVLVVVFLCCLSFKEGSSKESCPNAKYPVENDNVYISCWGNGGGWKEAQDPCEFNIQSVFLYVDFRDAIPEEAEPVEQAFYKVMFTGDGIDATASGKVMDEVLQRKEVFVVAEMKGDMPVGNKGTATINIYFNEQKDIPDWCSTTNITIVSEEGGKRSKNL